MTILDNEYVLIEHDPLHRIHTTVWKKYTPSSIYRQIIIARFEDILKNQFRREVTDLSLLPTITQEDSHWTVETCRTYYSQICEQHTHLSAIILAESTFTTLAMHHMLDEFGNTFTGMNTRLITKCFSNTEQAGKWLINQIL